MPAVRVAAAPSAAGGELVLRRDGDTWEVVANGVFLMDTRDGRSERLLVDAALSRAAGHERVVLAGLGLGTSLCAAVADPRPRSVTVLEHEPTLVEWHREHLDELTGEALADQRVEVVVVDALAWLREGGPDVDVLCLDIDNGPDWLVSSRNAWLYSDAGVAACVGRLRAGGVLAHWSASPAPRLAATMAAHLDDVVTHEVPTPRGAPDAVLVGTARVM